MKDVLSESFVGGERVDHGVASGPMLGHGPLDLWGCYSRRVRTTAMRMMAVVVSVLVMIVRVSVMVLLGLIVAGMSNLHMEIEQFGQIWPVAHEDKREQ